MTGPWAPEGAVGVGARPEPSADRWSETQASPLSRRPKRALIVAAGVLAATAASIAPLTLHNPGKPVASSASGPSGQAGSRATALWMSDFAKLCPGAAVRNDPDGSDVHTGFLGTLAFAEDDTPLSAAGMQRSNGNGRRTPVDCSFPARGTATWWPTSPAPSATALLGKVVAAVRNLA